MQKSFERLREERYPRLPAFFFLRLTPLLLLSLLIAEAPAANLHSARLRCECFDNPLGIDELHPQLSWIVESEARAEVQSAYQVLVSSRKDLLEQDRGDLWDSGKVTSENTTAITYAGSALRSSQRCYWKVRVWDRAGSPSGWSAPASWSMGLLHPGDWKAAWIGHDTKLATSLRNANFEEAVWVGPPKASSEQTATGDWLYVVQWDLPQDATLQHAELLAAAGGKLWASIQGKQVLAAKPGWEKNQPLDVTDVLVAGKNELRFKVSNDDEGPAALLVKLTAKTSTGKEIALTSDSSWQCIKTEGVNWQSRPLAEPELTPCREIGKYGCRPWGKMLFLPPAALFRKEFEVTRPVVSATLHVTAFGACQARLNGQCVSDDYFTPGWTDYAKRVYYRSYDVAEQIRAGTNALGGELSDGWFSGYVGWVRVRNLYGKKPRIRMQLHLVYEDGSSEIVGTGPDWKTTEGPTREADLLMGERFDARLIQAGWDQAGFKDTHWQTVATGAELSPVVESAPGPPVVPWEELAPRQITEPTPGVYVFDLGQNFAGVVRLKVRGARGQKIVLRFAERLSPDGTAYTKNLRAARATDTYICRGGEIETWQPRFTLHGFQYVEVEGLRSPPDKETITGVALSSDTPRAGTFACSDPMLNQLHKNIYWTQRSNFMDIPTDCPQRDERLGWTGDAQVYVATACLNADVQAFFRKWLVDLSDAQRPDGQFPKVAPEKVTLGDGGPAWADAGVICPWTIYEVYGDKRLLRQQYPSMKRFIEFCRQRSTEDLLAPEKYHCFGDWLSIKADTPKEVIYSAYFAYSAQLMAKAANVLGHKDDAQEYRQLFEAIKAAFNTAYVEEDGIIRGDTQCCYVLALAYGLLDEPRRAQAARHLVEDIASRGYHLSTGFIGTKDLMLVLSSIGRNDVAYRLIHNETFPSWGFSIKQGATSIWERWDGWTPEQGFQSHWMNSFAHYSFGAVYQWMFENIGGIRRAEPSYKHFVVAPQLGGDLAWAKTDYESLRGRISSRWEQTGQRLRLEVTVPANTTAEVRLPTPSPKNIREGGQPIATAPGVVSVEVANGETILRVGSGLYVFDVE